MGIYATVNDIQLNITKQILVQLTDDPKIGQVNDAVVESKIQEAEGIVHTALVAAGYTVPVATPLAPGAEVIKGAVVWLATCSLAARKGTVPSDYKDFCDRYHDILDKIANGELALPIAASSISNPQSSTEGQEPAFTRSKITTGSNDLRNPDQDHSLDVT